MFKKIKQKTHTSYEIKDSQSAFMLRTKGLTWLDIKRNISVEGNNEKGMKNQTKGLVDSKGSDKCQ